MEALMSNPNALPPDVPASAGAQIAALARMVEDDQPSEHRDAATRALHEFHRTRCVMEREAQDVGLEIHGSSAFEAMFQAGHRYADVWQRRVKTLEKVLRNLLAS